MGALHAGHLSLIRQAAQENSHVFVSIFVNPTQFGQNEDLSTYPRTWDADLKAITDLDSEMASSSSQHGHWGRVAGIFAPTTKTMYPTLPPSSDPAAQGSFVTITPLATLLEGSSRPIFFRGVTTVCMKLFNIFTPDKVYFGQKDIQQTVIIKRMVKDFCIGTEVRVGQTMREANGLALSSRNVYLGIRRRKVATVLYAALKRAEEQFIKGKRGRTEILDLAWNIVSSTADTQEKLESKHRARFEVDYISLADPETLEEVDIVTDSRGAVLSGAIRMHPIEAAAPGEDCGLGGGTSVVRLIDNIILEPIA